MISRILQTILEVASHLKIKTAIIGGLALPAYNVARTTLYIDICIKIESQKQLNLFVKGLNENDITTKQKPRIDHDLFTVFGKRSEAEIWLKPCDAFQWDNQMIEKLHSFFGNVKVLAVEDYLLTKLARSDRSAVDIDDILKIIIANKNSLDWNYFQFRLNWADLENDFKVIIKAFELDANNNVRSMSSDILNNFKNSNKKERFQQ